MDLDEVINAHQQQFLDMLVITKSSLACPLSTIDLAKNIRGERDRPHGGDARAEEPLERPLHSQGTNS